MRSHICRPNSHESELRLVGAADYARITGNPSVREELPTSPPECARRRQPSWDALVCSIRYRVRTFEHYCHQAVRPGGIIFAVIRMCGDFIQPRLGQMEGNFAYCPALHDEIILCPCVRPASFEVEALPNAQLA